MNCNYEKPKFFLIFLLFLFLGVLGLLPSTEGEGRRSRSVVRQVRGKEEKFID